MPDDLTDFLEFDAGWLRVPIGGKQYKIPPVSISTGLLLQRGMSGDEDAIKELNEPEVMARRVLGVAYDQMAADDVPEAALERALVAALADYRHGRIAAHQAWETGQDPEALAAVMAATQLILSTP